jgi:hypothetical protein
VVNVAADLAQFVQRRELLAYEQRVARAAYAYGVDLRRAAWLDHSTLGEPLMRSVDRRWAELVQGLSADVLEPPEKAAPTEVLEEISQLLRLLRAPLPTVRLLRATAPREDWPIATALGTTRGGTHWMILDLQRLMEMPATARTFLLGSALGNLQCDHGPMYAAHLMAYRGRGFSMIKSLLKPWSKVAVFSADRAGLLAVGELAPALEALEDYGQPTVNWLPPFPEMTLRRRALEDFDRSRVMTRLRLLFPQRADWTVAPSVTEENRNAARPTKADDEAEAEAEAEGDVAEKKEAIGAKPPPPPPPKAKAKPPQKKGPRLVEDEDLDDDDGQDDEFEDVIEQAEREAEKIEAEREEADAKQDDETTEQAKAEQIKKAWPLARCDARLTRRLGLL